MALTIAGSDSGGGAGLQADLRTFAAHRVHGTVAVTAVTAQNTLTVTRSHALPPDLVVAQVDAVTTDLPVVSVKTGMLATAEIVAAVGQLAAEGRLPNLVVDPVLVSSTGSVLMEPGGIDAYRRLLVPHASVLTPNLREAALLTRRPVAEVQDVEAMTAAASALRALGAAFVVVKGGDLARGGRGSQEIASAPDVVVGPDGRIVLDAERVATANDHGTGCSLSAAIAANLASGIQLPDAISRAKDFVHDALAGAASWRLGEGHGPVDHLRWGTCRAAVLPKEVIR